MNSVDGTKKVFKYNLSFYYQSTIIYFVVLLLYVVIKGEFVEDSFKKISNDPVVYFFLLVVLISLVAMIYNLMLNRHIEINTEKITVQRGSRIRSIKFSDIESIRVAKERRRSKSNSFTFIKIKAVNRKIPMIIIPYDYENKQELLETLKRIKIELGK